MTETSPAEPSAESALLFGHHGPPPRISLRHKLRRKLPWVEDFVLDRMMDVRLSALRRTPEFRDAPRRRILAVGVQSLRRPDALAGIFGQMQSDRHDIVFDRKGVEDKGKLQNVNLLLARHDLATFDWVWMVDDDVALASHFADMFVFLCEAADLKIAQPAHRAKSHASYFMTRRRYDSLVRETTYVEVGPITAFQRDTFADIFPLPDLRYGWGLDLTWPMLARRRGWRMGIVDAVPLEHLNPVAATYDMSAATEEARRYMDAHEFISRDECWQTLRKWNRLPITR